MTATISTRDGTTPAGMPDALRARVRERLAARPDGVLEVVARELGVSTLTVLEETPPDERRRIDPAAFEDVWRDMASWGEVLFIVHTADIVLECVGVLPVGTFGHGHYNIHGDGPIGGHIRADRCTAIHVVDRLFHGRRSCSVQFFNGEGEAMFKVFVRRDPQRALIADQLARFEALKQRYAT